ncbi:TPA: hypothetical protein SAO08_000261 [Burkholderia multivorans]|nr:hypothetical protein [Burkholderia multivorans]MBU9581964.1 hypothetical protein [Burkholderia multivorans]MBU9647783.1 hypothetical protein [Burkholderia multivorans]MBU9690105.1 hypothetical protein [Burkholderia multivorans]PRE09431.1 hypothetical protein C6P92_25415 [Burkholderia multivorans]
MQAWRRAYACRAILAARRRVAMRDILAGVSPRIDRHAGRARLCANRRYAGRRGRLHGGVPAARCRCQEPCARAQSLSGSARPLSLWCFAGLLFARMLRTERQWRRLNVGLGLLLVGAIVPMWPP